MSKRRAPRNNDAKAEATIAAAGWVLIKRRRLMPVVITTSPAKLEEASKRFVAAKRITEDDDTVTHRYESSYTIEDLAKAVVRREREEAR